MLTTQLYWVSASVFLVVAFIAAVVVLLYPTMSCARQPSHIITQPANESHSLVKVANWRSKAPASMLHFSPWTLQRNISWVFEPLPSIWVNTHAHTYSRRCVYIYIYVSVQQMFNMFHLSNFYAHSGSWVPAGATSSDCESYEHIWETFGNAEWNPFIYMTVCG